MKHLKIVNYNIRIYPKRNNNITYFSKLTLLNRYLTKKETYQDIFIRVSIVYSKNAYHAQKLYNYMSNFFFLPSTPILSNGGSSRGLPISCFLNEVNDNLNDIKNIWNENIALASEGGGIGTYWGYIRSIGEKIINSGYTSGIIPFLAVQDKLTLAISQGSLRRGSAAVYLNVNHPEIEEFIEIRRPIGGDINRKTLNLHHGIVISDDFMSSVENNNFWELKSPYDQSVIHKIKARDLWIKILLSRVETGEPYLFFKSEINKKKSYIYKKLNLNTKTSNLCSEITLTTGKDHLFNNRTAVCCLASINIVKYKDWSNDKYFIFVIINLLDNILQDFINHSCSSLIKSKYSSYRERSIGLGVMGFHSFLQSKYIFIESILAKKWNNKIFKYINYMSNISSQKISQIKKQCPDAKSLNYPKRFLHRIAIAPTATISIIAGNISPGIEPYNSNLYNQKTITGSYNIYNKYLKRLLYKKKRNIKKVWSSIISNEGSIYHLNFLNIKEKKIFKTSFEIDQQHLISLAVDRTKYICQSQSLNLFIKSNINKLDLNKIHYFSWKKGIKTLYYLRSKSLQRTEIIGSQNMPKKNL